MLTSEEREEVVRRALHVVMRECPTGLHDCFHECKYGALEITFMSLPQGRQRLAVFVDRRPVVTRPGMFCTMDEEKWSTALDLLRRAMALDDLAGV